MKALLLRLVFVSALMASFVVFATVANAQEHGDGDTGGEEHSGTSFIGGPNWDDAQSVTVWSIVGVGGLSVFLGVFYLFKRKIGAFPEHPTWVAPISIMPASQLPGDDGASDHAHDSHAPAH